MSVYLLGEPVKKYIPLFLAVYSVIGIITLFFSPKQEFAYLGLLLFFIGSLGYYLYHDPLEQKYEKTFRSLDENNVDTLTLSRIAKETISTNKRANINLLIGILFATVGIYILYSYRDYDIQNINNFYSFLPKLSLAIFIELFAYFFLNLYKKAMDEIKYYHNELTNIEMKRISLALAKEIKNPEYIQELLLNFVATERNPILSQGNTTIELEKLKLENENQKNMIESLKEMFLSKAEK